MQFILTGRDGKDSEAINRRMAVREMHLASVIELKSQGNVIWGGAILDDNGTMIGSVIVYEFESREDLIEMLKTEPYILGGVWENVDIDGFKLANI